MKPFYRNLLILSLVIGCATQIPHTAHLPAPAEPTVATHVIEVPAIARKTPLYYTNGTSTLPNDYVQAIGILKKWGNSDEFWSYVKSKRTYFSHIPVGMTVGQAVDKFREQLESDKSVLITFYTPWWPTDAIGGWDGTAIHENTNFRMTSEERAGHLMHESSHIYGWVHEGNYRDKNDNLNSFPYAVGYDFIDFVKTKQSTLAGSK